MLLPAVLLFLLALLSASLLVYPYIIYPAILRRLPTKVITPVAGHRTSITMLFCAYNEEASIPKKIENLRLLKSRHPELEIMAFDDGSSDRTTEMLAEDPTLLTLLRGIGRNGKAHGMKQMARLARGEVLIFTDANVTLREDAIDNIMAWYADPQVGGVCGALHYVGGDESTTASVGSAYWRLEERVKHEESRTGNIMGADGSIFSLRRSLYPVFPDSVLDDMTVSMAAVFDGKRLIRDENVVAFEGLVLARSEEFARKIRIASRAFHTHMFLLPKLRQMQVIDRFKYFSHKTLRWFGGAFLVASVVLTVTAVLLISVPLAFSMAVVLAAGLLIGLSQSTGKLASLSEIILALMATLIGVLRAMRGRTVTIWNPAKSR